MKNLLKGVAITTQTTQSRSLAALSEAEKDSTVNKPETEDNAGLLFTIYKNLNELYEKLNRLSYVMGKKIVELNLHLKGEGGTK
jgi:hypothetical protein